MTNLDQKPKQEAKRCTRCREYKQLSEFSFRNTEMRYESKCKVCRRELRKNKSDTIIKGHDFGAHSDRNKSSTKKSAPKQIIELDHGMTNAQVEVIDFSDLERRYGRELSVAERHDVALRFNEFIAILREGYSEMRGKNVFIRKD